MKSILEAAMIVCFGISWPISVLKTYRTKSTKGKSLLFLLLIFTGYVFGILAKVLFDPNYVLIFYVLNITFVTTDIALYLCYKQREKKNQAH